MKILVIPKQTLEGVLLATPVIRSISTTFDECEVSALVDRQLESILKDNIYLESIIDRDEGVKPEEYDKIIDLSEEKTYRKLSGKGVEWLSFAPQKLERWVLSNLKVNRLTNRHLVDQYMDFLKPAGLQADELGIDYFLSEKDHVESDWLPETHREGFIVFCIDAEYETRRLTIDRMIELCDRINKPIILLGTEKDVEIGKKIEDFFLVDESKPDEEQVLERELNKRTRIFNACGKFTLNQGLT